MVFLRKSMRSLARKQARNDLKLECLPARYTYDGSKFDENFTPKTWFTVKEPAMRTEQAELQELTAVPKQE